MRAPEVSTVDGYYGYKLGELVWQRGSSALWRLPCCFLPLAFVCSQLSFPFESMDHGKRPREGSPEAGGLLPHIRGLLREQG